MTYLPFLSGGTVLGLICLATGAAADLTAGDVWGDWRDYLRGNGYDVTATETAAGDTLAVSDITVRINSASDSDSMTVTLGTLEFAEAGDGTVAVVIPQTLPVGIVIDAPDQAEPTLVTLTYSHVGQRMIASGTPEAMTYDIGAESFGLALSDLSTEGKTLGADVARFTLSGSNLVGTTGVTVGDSRRYLQDLGFDTLVYDVFFQSPDGPETLTMNVTAEAVNFAANSVIPANPVTSAGDMNALLEAGFSFDGTLTSTGAQTRVEVTGPEGPTRIKTGSAATTFGLAMSTGGLRYDIASNDVQIGAELAGLPLPLYAEMAQSGVSLQSPVVRTEEAQDFALGFNLTDVTVADAIWGMVDPQGRLPRDPATLVLDLTGKARLLVDFLDPQAATRLQPGDAPAEVERVTINDLTLRAVGAAVNATGDITFDNSDKTTLPGMPKPVGGIDISVAGANALLDTLMVMGIVPQDQAMGARMMLGLFAVPGDAPDTLTSKIEFTENGQILANGQRIR